MAQAQVSIRLHQLKPFCLQMADSARRLVADFRFEVPMFATQHSLNQWSASLVKLASKTSYKNCLNSLLMIKLRFVTWKFMDWRQMDRWRMQKWMDDGQTDGQTSAYLSASPPLNLYFCICFYQIINEWTNEEPRPPLQLEQSKLSFDQVKFPIDLVMWRGIYLKSVTVHFHFSHDCQKISDCD